MTECFTCYLNLSKSRTGCYIKRFIRRYDVNALTLLTANVDVTLRGAVMVKKALTPRTQTANVRLSRRNIVV